MRDVAHPLPWLVPLFILPAVLEYLPARREQRERRFVTARVSTSVSR